MNNITLIGAILCFLVSCKNEPPKNKQINVDSLSIFNKENIPIDSVILNESFKLEDISINDYLKNELLPIRLNFKRINSNSEWSAIETRNSLESTEGGEIKYYFKNDTMLKIIVRSFGELYQELTEYYLYEGNLSFVYEKTLKYNRPMYLDSLASINSGDKEFFDINKSEVIETRSYFKNKNLLHQLNNEDCGSPYADDYLLEEKNRIMKNFESIKKQL